MIEHIENALHAAQEAALAENASLPPENERGLDCGFAWVVCKPANSKLGKALKAYGASKHHTGGVCLWSPAKANTQSISVHEAGANAFVAYLKSVLQEGIDYKLLYAASRLD